MVCLQKSRIGSSYVIGSKRFGSVAVSTYGDILLILVASILLYASELISVYSSSVKGYWLFH
jgi:hypothetical protein